MIKQKKLWDNILTVIMALLCLLWIYPIVLILLNSLKKEGTFTTSTVFQLPTSETFAGDRKSTRLNSSHSGESRMPSSA